jgi:hypothetical protein
MIANNVNPSGGKIKHNIVIGNMANPKQPAQPVFIQFIFPIG